MTIDDVVRVYNSLFIWAILGVAIEITPKFFSTWDYGKVQQNT
jgi:hypothetical protein